MRPQGERIYGKRYKAVWVDAPFSARPDNYPHAELRSKSYSIVGGHLRVPPQGGHAGPPLQRNCRLTAPWYQMSETPRYDLYSEIELLWENLQNLFYALMVCLDGEVPGQVLTIKDLSLHAAPISDKVRKRPAGTFNGLGRAFPVVARPLRQKLWWRRLSSLCRSALSPAAPWRFPYRR